MCLGEADCAWMGEERGNRESWSRSMGDPGPFSVRGLQEEMSPEWNDWVVQSIPMFKPGADVPEVAG